MIERIGLDEWFLKMVEVTALRSTCLRRQVGCVLVNRKHHVIATGYNGVTRGQPHCNEGIPMTSTRYANRLPGDMIKKEAGEGKFERYTFYPHACPGAFAETGTRLDSCYAVHAEQNALLQCDNTDAIWSCYTGCSPCITCTKLLLNTSCRRVVFEEPYAHDSLSRELWTKAGRLWLSRKPDPGSPVP